MTPALQRRALRLPLRLLACDWRRNDGRSATP